MYPGSSFELDFAKTYPQFTKKLIRLANDLTSKEIKICMFLRINYDAVQIQSHLGISRSTYFNSCSNIRKKLRLKRNESLGSKIFAI